MSWDPLLYDAALQLPQRPDWEIDLYRGIAAQLPGPVLELGAGTARILTALLNEGHDALGLENDPRMLAAGHERLLLNGQAQDRLLAADVCDFSLERSFGLILLPSNTISVLTEPGAARRMLDCAHRHLAAAGSLVLDMELPDGQPWRYARDMQLAGQAARFVEQGHFEARSRMLSVTRTLNWADGREQAMTVHMHQRTPAELLDLMQAAGFTICGEPMNLRGKPLAHDSRMMVARFARS